MVSIHKVPVIVHLIIRAICFTFRFKREVLHCRSLHYSSRKPIRNASGKMNFFSPRDKCPMVLSELLSEAKTPELLQLLNKRNS